MLPHAQQIRMPWDTDLLYWENANKTTQHQENGYKGKGGGCRPQSLFRTPGTWNHSSNLKAGLRFMPTRTVFSSADGLAARMKAVFERADQLLVEEEVRRVALRRPLKGKGREGEPVVDTDPAGPTDTIPEPDRGGPKVVAVLRRDPCATCTKSGFPDECVWSGRGEACVPCGMRRVVCVEADPLRDVDAPEAITLLRHIGGATEANGHAIRNRVGALNNSVRDVQEQLRRSDVLNQRGWESIIRSNDRIVELLEYLCTAHANVLAQTKETNEQLILLNGNVDHVSMVIVSLEYI